MEADPQLGKAMARIEGGIVIGRPVDVVFDYVADQSSPKARSGCSARRHHAHRSEIGGRAGVSMT